MYKVIPFVLSLRMLLLSSSFFSVIFMDSRLRAATNTVQVASYSFTPSNSVINVGDTITWRNGATIFHDSTQAGTPSLWQSGNIAPGGSFSFKFGSAGFFPYWCAQHVGLHPEQK